jgi:hypothetical protein
MTIWVVVFLIALLAFFLLCIYDCTETERERHRNPDASCCRGLLMVVLIGVMIWANGKPTQPLDLARNPFHVSFWNRSGRSHKGAPWTVTEYRRPDANLPAAEYLMGVELAKTNSCYFFDLRRDADIDRLKRCFHFFPDIKGEFMQKYEQDVGFCLA